MIDATGHPRTVLLLGGTSDIALAIARRYLQDGPVRVVLAARHSPRRATAAEELRVLGAEVDILDFDATALDTHGDVVTRAATDGDIDIAVVAAGQLGDHAHLERDHRAAADLALVNFVGAVSVGTALASRMREQGHGTIIALSSVAGLRPRASNYVYGSTKAGLDAYFRGLTESVRGCGVQVVVVRPGFVRSRMTQGLPSAPMPTTPCRVADAVVAGIRDGRAVIWAPGRLRVVMGVLTHLPQVVFRRLPQ